MDANSLTAVKVGGTTRYVDFYKGKLLYNVCERIGQFVNEEFRDEDVTECREHALAAVCGKNVSVLFQPVNVRVYDRGGVNRAVFDVLMTISMINPKTGVVTELDHISKDYEYEFGVYDDYAYYGCKQSDF